LSAYASWDVVRIYYMCKTNGWVVPTVYQGLYNAIARNNEAELLPALRTCGLRCYCYGPVAAGVLTGRYKSPEEIPTEGRFSSQFDFVSTKVNSPMKGGAGAMMRKFYFKQKLFDSLDVIRRACEAEKIAMADAAIRWLVHHSALNGNYHDGLLFGASSLKQVQDNLAAYASDPLPESLVKAYDEAWTVAAPEAPSYFRGYGAGNGTSELYLAKF